MRTVTGPLGTARHLESVLASLLMDPACQPCLAKVPAAWQATRMQRRPTSLQLLEQHAGTAHMLLSTAWSVPVRCDS